ncbi:MAG: hypothetical protein IT513_01545 [Burkholderiales bacterium]|nr:hypothetical protein [Burkholderiales bacterium]
MAKRIVIDESAINALLLRPIRDPKALVTGGAVFQEMGLRHLVVGNSSCIVSRERKSPTRLLVILFDGETPYSQFEDLNVQQEAMARSLRVAYRLFVPSIGIPRDWRPYHKPGKYVSFQASQVHLGITARIHIDPNPDKSRNAMLYYIGEQSSVEENPSAFYSEFRAALGDWQKALETPEVAAPKEKLIHTVELDRAISPGQGQGLTARQWYDLKLTKTQRDFIDYTISQPVRLKGPAGTGKTLAMVVKMLLEVYKKIDAKKKIRIGYVTHSLATADLVRDLVAVVDERGLLYNPEHQELISITTLQNLANEFLAFDLRGTEPVSLDAVDGRKTQLSFLSDILIDYRSSDWVTLARRCSPAFATYMSAEKESKESKFFLWELMNEFACVIEPEGVRDTAERRGRYLTGERRKWMMPLPIEADRQAVLDLHERFKNVMRQLGVVTIDEVISDYLRFLDSFQWNAIRQERGFDVMFVDELHLFNKQEREAFSMMGRTAEKPPVVLMAYDEKQSPRDTFLDVGAGESEQFDSLRVGKTKKFELSESFRYTPEITKALVAIDAHFPTLDFGAEWEALKVESNLPHGQKPSISVHNSASDQIREAIKSASEQASTAKDGREVAVLCLNLDLFQTYSTAGALVDKFLVLKSREDLTRLVHARKRFVISTPEQVAGLQFGHVVLVDVNEDEAPATLGMASVKRKFVSTLYLGASRARLTLEVHATKERGGLHHILKQCLSDVPSAFVAK